MKRYLVGLLFLVAACGLQAGGNDSIQSFGKAKKLLEREVYFDHRVTLYCDADFDAYKNITLPPGYQSDKYVSRSKRLEWEHVVPAENFGRIFAEWREGAVDCVTKKGEAFKGRRCATKANADYRLMQSDLYNLYPSIGSVNALRRNYNFALQPTEESDFGVCDMRIENRKAHPPVEARGRIARTYLYMERAYPRYKMSNAQRKLMSAWDKQYPVSGWECRRAERIRAVQGNVNMVLAGRC